MKKILQAINKEKTYYNIIMGDFNAKIGVSSEHAIPFSTVGKFGTPGHNERGVRMIEFSEANRLTVMNTLFQKKISRRWTWMSPDKKTKNEIDYILTDRPQIVTNMEAINSVKMSDHRLLRATIRCNEKLERVKMVNKVHFKVDTKIIEHK